MAQGDYIELHRKRFGRRFDHYERLRKRKAREGKLNALKAKKSYKVVEMSWEFGA